MTESMKKPVVVIPNLNGGKDLLEAVASLQKQTLQPHIIIVDNASTDDSAARAVEKFPDVELIVHSQNLGYAGGVNPGFLRAIELGAAYVAPFNDDATADAGWLEALVDFLGSHPRYGSVACKVLKDDKKTIDSTGDYVTTWGLPYPRGRGEADRGQYDTTGENGICDIFAASGAASLYRVEALRKVGLLDEDFFAYYEDVDLGFRMQLAGWKVGYEPRSLAYHKIGMTSGRIKGFTTMQTLKNLPLLIYKNVPLRYLPTVAVRYMLAEALFFGRACLRGQMVAALKGFGKGRILLLKKIPKRWDIQRSRTVSDKYIWRSLVHDLPPNAHALRKLRMKWWGLLGRRI